MKVRDVLKLLDGDGWYLAATEGSQRIFSNMRYAVVIEKGENNCAAYVPDLLGCAAAGETIEETEREIREAIEFHLRGMREDDLPIPEPRIRVEYIEVAA